MKLPFVPNSTIDTISHQVIRDGKDRYVRLAQELILEQPALENHFSYIANQYENEDMRIAVIVNVLDMYSMLKAQMEIESLEGG